MGFFFILYKWVSRASDDCSVVETCIWLGYVWVVICLMCLGGPSPSTLWLPGHHGPRLQWGRNLEHCQMSSSSSQRARLDVTCPTFDLLTQRYRHSQISWPQSNRCPPPRTLACRRHLTGRDAGPAALGILTAAAACPLPCRASVQMTQQNSEEQSTQTEFAAPVYLTSRTPRAHLSVLWPSARTAVGLTAPH